MNLRLIEPQLIRGLLALSLAGSLAACDGGRTTTEATDPPAAPGLKSIGGGGFAPLGSYSAIYGRAQVLRRFGGGTDFALHIEGLAAGVDYPAHVHVYPCEVNNAGGHYKLDPTVAETVEANEIWPAFRTDDDGIGRAAVSVAHAARMDAQSIVVHDPNNNNAKMACANLALPAIGPVVRRGEFAPFAAAEAVDAGIDGAVSVSSDADGTRLSARIQGLDPAAEYRSHIHELPCAVAEAGGHYKIDPSVEGAEEANELWPPVLPDANGEATVDYSNSHNARADAQSMVIHRLTAEGAPKVACANLERRAFYAQNLRGTATVLPNGVERGYADAQVSASIIRRFDGTTAASIALSGMSPDSDYPVHVHEYSCQTANGGGHYKIDDSNPATIEANEIWLNLRTDANGVGGRAVVVDHLARPEAQSMVVHDGADGARVICVDFG